MWTTKVPVCSHIKPKHLMAYHVNKERKGRQ
jgi:hypothetical protein